MSSIPIPGQPPFRACTLQPAVTPQRWSSNASAAIVGALPSDTGNGAQMHRWARAVTLAALARQGFTAPSAAMVQTIQAQGAHEGWYGFAKIPPEWWGSNNWGADDFLPGDDSKVPGCTGYFESHDKKADGTVISVKFRRYATPLDGAADLVHEAIVRRPSVAAVIDSGNLTKVAMALRAEHYFVAPAKDYALALWNQAQHLALANGEPLAVSLDADASSGGDSSSTTTTLALLAGLAFLGYYAFRA